MRLKIATRIITRVVAPAALLLGFALPAHIQAQAADQDHVVSSQALQQQAVTSSADRQKNIDTLKQLLDTPTAKKAMTDAKVDPVQVKSAIPTMSDAELANLSGRVTHAQSDLAAGYIGPGLFTIIILAIILIIIIIVVH